VGVANRGSAVGVAPAMPVRLRAYWSRKSVSAAPTVLVGVAVPTQASRPGLKFGLGPPGLCNLDKLRQGTGFATLSLSPTCNHLFLFPQPVKPKVFVA
jgi:hypothetical protein